ncbi:histidine phosphatase family protein [Maricaulis sp.]|jgi:phosphohistidine phosphatase SixA|uniref:histidine phosphatase family protein n=1 Tax=Maricaulis sp. TaxID=1486257 RepID=UPI00261607FE|nr:histidine phosphatase family protein [Maricaulis sp.]
MLLTVLAEILLVAQPVPDAPYDRPQLSALAPVEVRAALEAADRHVLVVRHARKISPDCNGMECPLSPEGEAMVARLADLLGEAPVGRAYASAACRTRLTAAAGGVEVVAHQAVDGYTAGCTPGETVSRQRSAAFAETQGSPVRWTLAAEHSNTTCLWLSAFAGPDAARDGGCIEGRLPDTAYGDIFWLYRIDGDWRLTVLEDAFDLAAE